MFIKEENGMRTLYPSDPRNILRSRITGNVYEQFLFLSKNEPMEDYSEEAPLDPSVNSIEKLEALRNKKINDLDAYYKIIKNKIECASSIEELIEIQIFK